MSAIQQVLLALNSAAAGSWHNAFNWTSGGAADEGGWTNYTKRDCVDKSLLHAATKIRVTLVGGNTGGGAVFTKMYMQTRAASGDSYDFSTTPVQVTFSAVGNGTLTSSDLVSDEIILTIDASADLILSYHLSSGVLRGWLADPGNAELGSTTAFYKSGDDATTVNATGYSASGTRAISKLELFY